MERNCEDIEQNSLPKLNDPTCKYCFEVISTENLFDHHGQCEKVPLVCPNQCGTVGIPRSDLESHLTKVCPITKMEAVMKKFESEFCEVVQLKKKYENVTTSNLMNLESITTSYHGMENTIIKLQTRFDEENIRNELQERELYNLKSTTQKLEQTIAIQAQTISTLQAAFQEKQRELKDFKANFAIYQETSQQETLKIAYKALENVFNPSPDQSLDLVSLQAAFLSYVRNLADPNQIQLLNESKISRVLQDISLLKGDILEAQEKIVALEHKTEALQQIMLREMELNVKKHSEADLANKAIWEKFKDFSLEQAEFEKSLKQIQEDIQEEFSINEGQGDDLAKLTGDLSKLTQNYEEFERMFQIKLETLNDAISNERFEMATLKTQIFGCNESLKELNAKFEEQSIKISSFEGVSKECNNVKNLLGGQSLSLRLFEEKLIAFNQKVLTLQIIHPGVLLWKITEFSIRRSKKEIVISPEFYAGVYKQKMHVRLYTNGRSSGENTHLSIFYHLIPGPYDEVLDWPFEKRVSFTLLSQGSHRSTCKDNEGTILPLDTACGTEVFSKPSKNKEHPGCGFNKFISIESLQCGGYVQDDAIYILIKVHD